MRLTILTFLILLPLCVQGQQLPMQRPGLNQGQLWNPALTAPSRFWEAGALFQQQWVGFPGAPNTLMAYAQYPWQRLGMSAGMVLLMDVAGPIVHTGVQLSYAFRIRPGLAGDDLLSLGIQARMAQWRFDPSRVVARDEADLMLQEERNSVWGLSPGFGLFYSSHRSLDFDVNCWYVGLSADQLGGLALQPEEYNLPGRQPHYRGMIGYRHIDYNRMWEPILYMDVDRLYGARVGANLRFEQDRSYWGLFGAEYNGLFRMGGGYVLRTDANTSSDLLLGTEMEYNLSRTGRVQGLSYFLTLAWRGYMVSRM
jgi:type IX secretion system PorP/SprF family membrane protein